MGSTLVLMNRFSVQTCFPIIKTQENHLGKRCVLCYLDLLSAMEKEKSIVWQKSHIQSLKFIRSGSSAPLPVEIHQVF